MNTEEITEESAAQEPAPEAAPAKPRRARGGKAFGSADAPATGRPRRKPEKDASVQSPLLAIFAKARDRARNEKGRAFYDGLFTAEYHRQVAKLRADG